jgi:hypothetical protein
MPVSVPEEHIQDPTYLCGHGELVGHAYQHATAWIPTAII